ncbi:hypothetical protein [Haliangium ochraceum]|uniref:Lipoprotein n=1 Tax=Haliangium ochraceum (strain DSM 14365 / JCM 11303 / SMP-2) TaxID=502025 RepID=D0LZA4_HALO1|nr:hypothetical protein [Haliangium ochraceum]ACY16366.1 hypothetical protein Hoch_3867 [Haliangium ochraceum DSM 14365]
MRLLALAVLLMAACSSAPKPAPEAPEPAGPEPPVEPVAVGDTDWCLAAEQRLEELGCLDPRGEPMWINRNGERFARTCETIHSEGGVFLNPQCIAEAASCEEADACPAAR